MYFDIVLCNKIPHDIMVNIHLCSHGMTRPIYRVSQNIVTFWIFQHTSKILWSRSFSCNFLETENQSPHFFYFLLLIWILVQRLRWRELNIRESILRQQYIFFNIVQTAFDQSWKMSNLLHGPISTNQILPREKRVNRNIFGTSNLQNRTYGVSCDE